MAAPAIAGGAVLSQAELGPIVGAAIDRWAAAGASADQIATMRAVVFDVEDMSGIYLGKSSAGHITIDSDAAGHGWFVDTTPGEDSEFDGSGGPAGDHMDLLTVVMHELGHQIGLEDDYHGTDEAELMNGALNAGERRLPEAMFEAQTDGAAGGQAHWDNMVLPGHAMQLPIHDVQMV
jgi:hypothetical protein